MSSDAKSILLDSPEKSDEVRMMFHTQRWPLICVQKLHDTYPDTQLVRAYRTIAAELMAPWRCTLNIPSNAMTIIPIARRRQSDQTPAAGLVYQLSSCHMITSADKDYCKVRNTSAQFPHGTMMASNAVVEFNRACSAMCVALCVRVCVFEGECSPVARVRN